MSTHLIPIDNGEFVTLLHGTAKHRRPMKLAFGPGGVALTVDDEAEPDPVFEQLEAMRGISNENMYGAGI